MDGYIYRASLSSVVFLPSYTVIDLHKSGREVLLADLGISTDSIVSRGYALATSELNLKYFAPLKVCLVVDERLACSIIFYHFDHNGLTHLK